MSKDSANLYWQFISILVNRQNLPSGRLGHLIFRKLTQRHSVLHWRHVSATAVQNVVSEIEILRIRDSAIKRADFRPEC